MFDYSVREYLEGLRGDSVREYLRGLEDKEKAS